MTPEALLDEMDCFAGVGEDDKYREKSQALRTLLQAAKVNESRCKRKILISTKRYTWSGDGPTSMKILCDSREHAEAIKALLTSGEPA